MKAQTILEDLEKQIKPITNLLNNGYRLYGELPSEPKYCKFCGDLLDIDFITTDVFRSVMECGYKICTCKEAQKAEKERIESEKKEREQKEKDRLARYYAQKTKQLLKQSGISKRYQTCTFETFKTATVDQKRAYNAAKKYADEFTKASRGLYMIGDFGRGKTHLAVAIGQALIAKINSVLCLTSIELLDHIKNTFNYGEEATEKELLKLYCDIDLLIIDDLGKENGTEWAISKLYQIIDNRYSNDKPIIITTNYSDKELIARLAKNSDIKTAGAILSRLYGMCDALVFKGNDYRQVI